MNISKERLLAMRERHPAGTRITLQAMNDPYSRLRPGDTGTLVLIDDIGTYHIHWDNGSSLGLIPGEDSFSCQPPEQHELKLWMPITADFVERVELGEDAAEPVFLGGYFLGQYQGEIQEALEDYVDEEEQERGVIVFQTAWSAPHPVIQGLSEKYPEVSILHEWADEDIGRNCGWAEYEHGEEVQSCVFDGGPEARIFRVLLCFYKRRRKIFIFIL